MERLGFARPVGSGKYNFVPEDLDAVLYGFVRIGRGVEAPVHSMSGIRFGAANGIKRTVQFFPPKVPPEGEFHESFQDPFATWPPLSLALPTTNYPDFPSCLCLRQLRMGNLFQKGVFSKEEIKKGTRFGPYLGMKVGVDEGNLRDQQFSWEIFDDNGLFAYIDGYYEETNWLKNINCARYSHEENLNLVQCGKEIYYETTKNIKPGEELLVWYGSTYDLHFGIPIGMATNNVDVKANGQEDSGAYPCERCGKVFAYKYYKDKHLKYTKCVDQGNRKFPCDQCPRSFEKRDRLRIHILHVHEKHRPHECNVCGKKFSQSSSLNKHQRVHSGERPYKCPECNKAFTASSILRTHLRQHSGERPFKCVHCGKAFASHAAHDSHVRRTHTKQKPCICGVCGKAFSQAYELKFHMNIHTGNKPYSCERCGRCFSSPSSRDRHRLHFDCLNRMQRKRDGDNDMNNNAAQNQV